MFCIQCGQHESLAFECSQECCVFTHNHNPQLASIEALELDDYGYPIVLEADARREAGRLPSCSVSGSNHYVEQGGESNSQKLLPFAQRCEATQPPLRKLSRAEAKSAEWAELLERDDSRPIPEEDDESAKTA